VIYNDANPEWNQELKIGLKVKKKKQIKFFKDLFQLKLILYRDRASKDDMISTLFLNLQDISDCSENGIFKEKNIYFDLNSLFTY